MLFHPEAFIINSVTVMHQYNQVSFVTHVKSLSLIKESYIFNLKVIT